MKNIKTYEKFNWFNKINIKKLCNEYNIKNRLLSIGKFNS